MSWVISFGGTLIIAAVLGILIFITKEATPLFRSAHTKDFAKLSVPANGAIFLDESGAAAMTVSASNGIQTFALPSGQALKSVAEGPALPWKVCTSPEASGRFAIIDGSGKLALGQFKWEKPSVATDAAHWVPSMTWQGELETGPELDTLFHVQPSTSQGLEGGSDLKIAGTGAHGLIWAQAPLDQPSRLAWKSVPLPDGQTPSAALWSSDASLLYVGTREGFVHLFESGDELNLRDSLRLSEGVASLGFALGQTSLLVGGEKGSLAAVQAINVEGTRHLQLFHRFKSLSGPVLGFMPSLRDKRFLAWTSTQIVVDHLTTEQRLLDRRVMNAPGDGRLHAALSARGGTIATLSARDSEQGALSAWSLDAPHPEVSSRILWNKVHYEGYAKPEFVWQSTGGSDDFEPKLSLVPLVFGTIKGTLYAMLFALPLAILGALYTSQFATPRFRNTIKPLIEVMAALPSVVLGFLAGLVLAPLFERASIQLLVLPLSVLMAAMVMLPFWSLLSRRTRTALSQGREVIWVIPVLALGLLIATLVAPSFERVFLQGDFRAWLLQHHNITYDQRNSLVVGFAMGFAVIPIIFTISEDALTSVPRSLTSASLACGASPWQTAWRVVLPTASPGIFSAVMVGFGRAIGETMIVLMATGNTPVMDWNPFNGMRTLAANIAVETPEAPMHGTLYRVLFFTALLLFALTFILNTVAELVRQHLRKRYESL